MDYAEASYFDGYHFQHVAAWRDHQRLLRARADARRALDANRACARVSDRLGRWHLHRS